MDEDHKNYDIFLSYAAEDKAVVERCYQLLKSFGLNIFFDSRSIVPGDAYAQKIPSAVKNSKYLLVFLSALSYHKKWVAMEVNAAHKFNIKVIPILIGDCNLSSSKNEQKAEVPVLYPYIDLQDISKIKLPFFEQDPLHFLPEIQTKNVGLPQDIQLLERYAEQLSEQCSQYRKDTKVKYDFQAKTKDFSFYFPVGNEDQPVSAEIGIQKKENSLRGYLKIFSTDSNWHTETRQFAKQKILACFSGMLQNTETKGRRSTLDFFVLDLAPLNGSVCKDFSDTLQAAANIMTLFFAAAAQCLKSYDEMMASICRTKKVFTETLSSVFCNHENWYCEEDSNGVQRYTTQEIGKSHAEDLAVFMEGKGGFFELTAELNHEKDQTAEAELLLKSKIFSFEPEIFNKLREHFKDLNNADTRHSSSDIFCKTVFRIDQNSQPELSAIAKKIKSRIAEFFALNEQAVFKRLKEVLYNSQELVFENNVRRIISATQNTHLRKYPEIVFCDQQLTLVVKHPAIYFGTTDLFPITLKKNSDRYKIDFNIAELPGIAPDFIHYFKKNFENSETLPLDTPFDELQKKLEAVCNKRQNDFFELYNKPVKEFCNAIHKIYQDMALVEKNSTQDECYAARCNCSIGIKLCNGITAAVVSPNFGLWDMRLRLSGNLEFNKLDDSVKKLLFNYLQAEAAAQDIQCEIIEKDGRPAAFDMRFPEHLRNFLPLADGAFRDINGFCEAAATRIKILQNNLQLMQVMLKG